MAGLEVEAGPAQLEAVEVVTEVALSFCRLFKIHCDFPNLCINPHRNFTLVPSTSRPRLAVLFFFTPVISLPALERTISVFSHF